MLKGIDLRKIYRAANAIIGRHATEDVILQLIRSKCLPAAVWLESKQQTRLLQLTIL